MSLTSENQEDNQLKLGRNNNQQTKLSGVQVEDVPSIVANSVREESSLTQSIGSSSSILDQLTKSTSSSITSAASSGSGASIGSNIIEKGGVCSNISTNGSTVMPNVFPAGPGQVRQDPASSSLSTSSNNNSPTMEMISSSTTTSPALDNQASPALATLVGEERDDPSNTATSIGQKKKSKSKKIEAVKMDEGEKEVLLASFKNKRIQAKAVCSNCGCTDTPTWRKGPLGIGTLCNACGIKHSTNSIALDPTTGAHIGMRPFVKFDESPPGPPVGESYDGGAEVKTEETTVASSSASLPTLDTTAVTIATTAVATTVSTPEKQGKRSRGRPKGSGNKKKNAPSVEASVVASVADIPVATVTDNPGTPQMEANPPKRGRGRPRTKPIPIQPPPSQRIADADNMADDVDEPIVVGSGKGKRKRKVDDDEYVPEEEKPIVTKTKIKQRKVAILPVGSDAQVLSLQNLHKLFSNTSDNCIHISSDYLMQCIEGFKLTIKQGSKKNNGEINRRITTDSLIYTFFFLDMSDLLTCFSVCRHWHESAKSDVIWKEIYRRSWGIDEKSLTEYTTEILAPAPSINWFKLVQSRINIRVYSPIQQIHLMSQFYAIENKPKILSCMQENLNEEITARKNNTTPKL